MCVFIYAIMHACMCVFINVSMYACMSCVSESQGVGVNVCMHLSTCEHTR